MNEGSLLVTAAGVEYRVAPDESLTFGRSPTCTVRIDSDDTAIPRVAGSVEHDGGVWWLANVSASGRHFATVDQVGLRAVLPAGRRIAIEGRLRVVLSGLRTSHELILRGPAWTATPAAIDTGVPTATGEQVLVNAADRAAMVALFAGYLQKGDRYDPHPRTYNAAAKRLGWQRTTLVKRIEYLRKRLTKAGVPDLEGSFALYNLAEHALNAGLINPHDLGLIHSPPAGIADSADVEDS